ncbi:MAG: TVP38/TMEM64 family protein [OCS116 cluster bacterium]|uniref:TVP38/TMEM64 family membrane protein n=1 Tax=OCS116 cluster bacterium TaxID=2030921 RepID=A0A2A4YX90_9PROT|nr:TVP38/TMEM64 family protein [OCS116 cluster bacterium]
MHKNIKKFLPLIIFAGIFATIWATGLHQYVSFQKIAEYQSDLESYVDANFIYALLIFVGIYIAATAFSLPGASILSLLGGLLFGGIIGGFAIVVAATLGAISLFLIASTSFGDILRQKAGKWMEKIAAEFNDGAASYLLFLRLVPLFPFFVVNLAPALLGARLWTFAWTTFLGIIPATFAFTFVGEGIGSVLTSENEKYQQCLAGGADNCTFEVSATEFFSRELLIGLAVMGCVALIPILYKKIKARKVLTSGDES